MFGTTVAWGLDIGSSTVKAIKVRKTGGGGEVIDFDVIEVEHSDDESTRDMRNGAAIAELVRRKKFGTTPVVVSVPGNQVFFRPFNLPAVGERKVPEIVRYEARQQVPFPLEEVVWDYRVAPTGAGELAVSLVAIRKEIVERLLESMREHQLNVVGLAPSPVAVLNYVQYDVQPLETSLILDAGSKVTDFVILHGGSFWFRPLPVAGSDITHVFEQKFRMPFGEAENLKVKLGESKQYEKMFQVVEPILRSLAGEIQRTSGYYLSLQRNVRISRVFGLGHTFRLPGLVGFLNENIEMELEMVSAPQRIAVSSGIDTTWFAEEFPGMGTALGLALQGLGLAQVEMSLLPESLIKEQRAGGRRKLFIAVAAAIWALVASQYIDARNETAGLEEGPDPLNPRMESALKDLHKKQLDVNGAGKLISPRKRQLERWSRTGSQRGIYSEVASKLLAKVGEHNKKALDEHVKRGGKSEEPPLGKIFLSEMYVSRRNPRSKVPAIGADSELQRLAARDRTRDFYVAAKFECRAEKGDPRPDQSLDFEKALHAVRGFRSVRGKLPAGQEDIWLVRGHGPEYLVHFTEAWRKGKPTQADGLPNAWVFWGLWLYDPEAVEEGVAAASGGGTKG